MKIDFGEPTTRMTLKEFNELTLVPFGSRCPSCQGETTLDGIIRNEKRFSKKNCGYFCACSQCGIFWREYPKKYPPEYPLDW